MSINPDFSDKSTLEKFSAAASLSDMEIYVFPELLYPMVIANIMSPIIWEWRNDPWFKDIGRKSFTYKLNRIKQYIMEHYVFNLDLETWGLTTKEKETDRFRQFIDMDTIRQSNALFGYEGDKYYFDIDIRRHFGLDKYTSNVIPYWKTETVEAMTAFRYKESFTTGAGECVSFSALFAAALFIVGGIPLESIFLIGTPLHSQNFIEIQEGALTNNRRIVTKKMWFNGTSMSAKARRALEKERITLVAHISGFIHHAYDRATIQQAAYERFSDKLGDFLVTALTPEVFVNFLRYHMNFKKCFQYRHLLYGHAYYIALETVFSYEHQSKFSFSESTREALLNEIDDEEFSHTPLRDRIIIQDAAAVITKNSHAAIPVIKQAFIGEALKHECNQEANIELLFEGLSAYLQVKPRLPKTNKSFIEGGGLNIHAGMTRPDVLEYIAAMARDSEMALLSLYVYRQMDQINWKPFIKAALERNPVSLESLRGKPVEEVYHMIAALPNDSIYDGKRLAQPDEVWNFGRGDGLEKAFLFANFLYNERKPATLRLVADEARVILEAGSKSYGFKSDKQLVKEIFL